MNIQRNFRDHQLEENMKDNKANYLFKQLRLPKDLEIIDIDNIVESFPLWEKYEPLYKFPEIYLDNKLEELLNIFGRRQCQSCIEFNTGAPGKIKNVNGGEDYDEDFNYLWEDPRRCRSFPLSPKGELLYQGMAGDFNLIDFQLEDNVYHEVEAPTEMFESVARDLSECGVQVFEFDVMKALNRKGGDLITPGIDDHDARRKGQKKKRGRKNKYYKQIDQEDDEEANQISGESDEGLDGVKEEDNEDDEEEIQRKKQELEERERIKREAERLRKEKAEADKKADLLRKQESENKKLQEEAERKKAEAQRLKEKEEEEKRILDEQNALKALEAERLRKEKE